MEYDRVKSEKILRNVAKTLKMTVSETPAKGGDHTLQVIKNGDVKVSVRKRDIVAFVPQDYLKLGKAEIAPWVHVTRLHMLGDADLEKAFTKALKDTKSSAQWKAELKFAPKAAKVKEDATKGKEKAKETIKKAKAVKKVKNAIAEKAIDAVVASIIPVTPEVKA